MTDLLILPVLLPLLAALLALLLPALAVRIGQLAALLASVAVIALLWQLYHQGAQNLLLGGWSQGLAITLYADGLTGLMLLMATLVALVVSLFASDYFASTDRITGYFWPLWLLLQAAIAALLLSADLFNLYVTLELLGLSAVSLTALGGNTKALKAALDYLLLGLLGSLVFLAAVVLIYARYGTLDMLLLAQLISPDPLTWVALALFTASLVLKCALFPLHVWLPAVHASAPAPVSAALSALVVKVAFYLLLRLWADLFAPVITPLAAQLLGLSGALAVLWGSWQAVRAARLKLLAAYSTLAQLGYLLLFFALLVLMPEGEARELLYGALLLFVLGHGFAKSALFLAAGTIQQQLGHDQIARLGGLAQRFPVTLFSLALAGVALVGLPPSGAFLAKWQLLAASISQGLWLLVLVVVAGSLLACVYLFRVLAQAFGPADEQAVTTARCDEAGALLVSPRLAAPLLLAVIATLVLGLAGHGVWLLLSAAGGGF